MASEPEEPLISDEPPGQAAILSTVGEAVDGLAHGAAADGDRALALPSLFASMPVGVQVGTFVHRVLEATEFDAHDLEAELTTRVAEVQGRHSVEIGDPAAVVAGLAAILQTPLGTVLDGRGLRDFTRRDRLDELGFELPLAGGDRPAGALTLSRLAEVLREHLDPEDPLLSYAHDVQCVALGDSFCGIVSQQSTGKVSRAALLNKDR